VLLEDAGAVEVALEAGASAARAGETPYFVAVARTPRPGDGTDATMISFLSTAHLQRSVQYVATDPFIIS
jgi:hypothetical protein